MTSIDAFDKAWEIMLSQMEIDAVSRHRFLHISAHGSSDGLELTDGDCLEWEALTNRLQKAHQRLGPVEFADKNLPKDLPAISLTMSSCSAFVNFRKAVPAEQPYQALVGPSEDVGWCESLIAFSTYYYASRSKKEGLRPAVRRMNQAISGTDAGKFQLDFNHQTIAYLDSDHAKQALASLKVTAQ